MLVINMVTLNGMHYDIRHGKGDLLVMMSAICWAVYSVFGKKTVFKLGGYVTTTWVVIMGAIEMLLLLPFMSSDIILPTTGSDWLIVVYIAIFPSAIAFFAYYEALRLIKLSLLNIMQYLTPVFTMFLAYFVLGEAVTLLNIVGIILVLSGVMMTTGKVPLLPRKLLKRQC
jgi:drug/metabolite transporter (DMT)-like permease